MKFKERFSNWVKGLFPEPQNTGTETLSEETTTNSDRHLGLFCGLLTVVSGIGTLLVLWNFSFSLNWLFAFLLVASWTYGLGWLTYKGFREVPVGWKGQLLFSTERLNCFFGEGWRWTPYPFSILMEDCREKIMELDKLEATTKNDVTVEVSVTITYKIVNQDKYHDVDPSKLQRGLDDLRDQALRVAIRKIHFRDLLGMNEELAKTMHNVVREEAETRWGIKIISVVIPSIKGDDETKKKMELMQQEIYEREGQRLETAHFDQLVDLLVNGGTVKLEDGNELTFKGGIPKEEAIIQVQLALGKIQTKDIKVQKFGFDNGTVEAIAKVVALLKGGGL